MRSRCTLALHLIDDFAAWAQTQGWERLPLSRNEYEVLRLRRERDTLVYYKKRQTLAGDEPFHATTYGLGARLVRAWIRERKRAKK